MPNWLWVLVVIGLLSVFISGAFVLQRHREVEIGRVFDGHVIDKKHEQYTLTSGVRHDFWLMVQRDDGQIEQVMVDRARFQSFDVGDRVVKRAGERWPTRVHDRP